MTDITLLNYAEEEFAMLNREAYDAYIDYRIQGLHMQIAFARLFGDQQDSHLKCEFIEHNPYVRREYARKLKEAKVEELWDEKKALAWLLAAAQNPHFKDSTRLQATRELNILCGITTIDEQGRTRKMPGLAELYGKLSESLPTESQQ